MTNVFTEPVGYDEDDPPGFRAGYVRLGPKIGAKKLGATVYELRQGEAVCPYHYEYGNEEWLLVLKGRPTLRTPDGEREVAPGELVCFNDGKRGAHQVRNARKQVARVLLLSTKNTPDVSVYPDSGKVGIWGVRSDGGPFRRRDRVGYWEGEV
jgi:uncharacterized cupin superfamily protein